MIHFQLFEEEKKRKKVNCDIKVSAGDFLSESAIIYSSHFKFINIIALACKFKKSFIEQLNYSIRVEVFRMTSVSICLLPSSALAEA